MPTSEKSELGIKPEKQWVEQRTKDLSDALSKHANKGEFPKSMVRWAEELLRRMKERVDMEE